MRCLLTTLMLLAGGAAADVIIRDDAEQTVVRYDRSYALLIGVSDYTAGWRDLPSIPGELAQVEAVLAEHDFEITKVIDPTEAELRQAFERFIDDRGYVESHRLLVYFGGHGYSREIDVGVRGYLVPADAPRPTEDLQSFLSKAVPMEDVVTWARRIEAKHALFVFDSCFSGTVFDTRGELPQPSYITAKTGRSVRQFLTAGSANEELPGTSVFTPAFVSALRGEADLVHDGYITGTELGVYLDQNARYSGQTPQFGRLQGYHEGDFVFRVVPPRPAELEAGDPWTDPALGMKFRYVPLGTFLMGSPDDEPDRRDNETRHEVTLTQSIWMGETEVTQVQWEALMENNPSRFTGCGDHCPVEQVNWFEAVAFANALSVRAGYTPCYRVSGANGKKAGEGLEYEAVEWVQGCTGYRLPTEAEWERASRGGTSTAIYSGDITIRGMKDSPELDPIAWYGGNSGVSYSEGLDCSKWSEKQFSASLCGPHPVGQKQPNPWGLHDTLGNVWEWTWDWTGSLGKRAEVDPIGPAKGSARVYRGGSWISNASSERAAYRHYDHPSGRRVYLGFRLARSQEVEPGESR